MWSRLIADLKQMLSMLMRKDSFVQNSALMFSASGFSLIIQFAFFPILARIYSPESYGLFAVFNFYSATLGSAASLAYSQAFVLAETERQFRALVKLCVWIAAIICGSATLLGLLAGKSFLQWVEAEELGYWVYLIGPMAFVIALDRITQDWATRNKAFRKQTIWSTTSTLFSKSFNALYGWITSGIASGLFITNFVIFGFQSLAYLLFVIKQPWDVMREKFSWSELKHTARHFAGFPKYIFPGNFLNTFSNNLPAALLPATGFAISSVGFYNNALLVLDIPVRLLGSGVSSVFLPKAAEVAAERPHEMPHISWKLFRNMLAISLTFSALIYLAGRPMYSVLLGTRWQMAGSAAEVLAVYYYFRLISAPLAVVFNVKRKEREYFIFQSVLLLARLLSLVLGSLVTSDFLQVMMIFSAANAVCYFLLSLRIMQLAGVRLWRTAVFTLGWGGSAFIVMEVLKHLLGWHH